MLEGLKRFDNATVLAGTPINQVGCSPTRCRDTRSTCSEAAFQLTIWQVVVLTSTGLEADCAIQGTPCNKGTLYITCLGNILLRDKPPLYSHSLLGAYQGGIAMQTCVRSRSYNDSRVAGDETLQKNFRKPPSEISTIST